MGEIAYIQLGSNRGERSRFIRESVKLISLRCGPVLAASRVFESEPWGFSDEQDFLNQVISIRTGLLPLSLLHVLQSIERDMGRLPSPETGYQGRCIDLDVLFYGDQIVDFPELKVPHPRLHLRKFVLVPLCDIAPGFVHPAMGQSIAELLKCATDPLRVSLPEKTFL